MEGSVEDPKTVQTELPYGPQMLELFSKELRSGFWRDIIICVFMFVLFMADKVWKQLQSP